MAEAGVTDSNEIIAQMRSILQQIKDGRIEYVSIVDAETLENVDKITGRVLAAVAVKLGPARLIDNILMDAKGQ